MSTLENETICDVFINDDQKIHVRTSLITTLRNMGFTYDERLNCLELKTIQALNEMMIRMEESEARVGHIAKEKEKEEEATKEMHKVALEAEKKARGFLEEVRMLRQLLRKNGIDASHIASSTTKVKKEPEHTDLFRFEDFIYTRNLQKNGQSMYTAALKYVQQLEERNNLLEEREKKRVQQEAGDAHISKIRDIKETLRRAFEKQTLDVLEKCLNTMAMMRLLKDQNIPEVALEFIHDQIALTYTAGISHLYMKRNQKIS